MFGVVDVGYVGARQGSFDVVVQVEQGRGVYGYQRVDVEQYQQRDVDFVVEVLQCLFGGYGVQQVYGRQGVEDQVCYGYVYEVDIGYGYVVLVVQVYQDQQGVVVQVDRDVNNEVEQGEDGQDQVGVRVEELVFVFVRVVEYVIVLYGVVGFCGESSRE